MVSNSEGPVAFAQRYGRWALIAGASEGVGACAAEQAAARGLDVVLIARNRALLGEVAAGIRHPQGVDVCCAVIGRADTPARARSLGVEYDPETDMRAEAAASEILDNVGFGPIYVVGEANRALAGTWTEDRRVRMAAVSEAMQAFAEREQVAFAEKGVPDG